MRGRSGQYQKGQRVVDDEVFGASRRLAEIMRSMGWMPVRVRDLTRGGYKEQVRGYARDAGGRSN